MAICRLRQTAARQLSNSELTRRQLSRSLAQVCPLQLGSSPGSPERSPNLLEDLERLSKRGAGALAQLATPLDSSDAQERSRKLERHGETPVLMHRPLQVHRRASQVTAGRQQQPSASLAHRHRPRPIQRTCATLEGIQQRLRAVELAKRDQRIERIR